MTQKRSWKLSWRFRWPRESRTAERARVEEAWERVWSALEALRASRAARKEAAAKEKGDGKEK